MPIICVGAGAVCSLANIGSTNLVRLAPDTSAIVIGNMRLDRDVVANGSGYAIIPDSQIPVLRELRCGSAPTPPPEACSFLF